MNIVAIIQARFNSTRQPGKVLMPLGSTTVLAQVISRVRQASRLDTIWVATTSDPADDAIVEESIRLGVPYYRGSVSDVLARYHTTAQAAEADVIVRITSDCPLFDGSLLDEMLTTFINEVEGGNQIDYFSNVIVRSFPRGLDAEIITFEALDRAMRETTRDYDREHVTPYFYNNPELFNLYSYMTPQNLMKHRWTLDTAEDLSLIRTIYEILSPDGETFTTNDILNLLDKRPELCLINAHVEQQKDAAARANLP